MVVNQNRRPIVGQFESGEFGEGGQRRSHGPLMNLLTIATGMLTVACYAGGNILR
jgi:hypothetical protein